MTPGAAALSSDTGDFEAVSEAELVPEASAPEASPAHLGRGPSADSGVRLSPAALATRIEAALAASARTEATLADLTRTAKFLSASITAVRDANAELVRELEVLCSTVTGDGTQRVGLERRIQLLERVVDETTRDAVKERQFLMDEHDAFLASLLGDHERELDALRRRLRELESVPPPPISEKSGA